MSKFFNLSTFATIGFFLYWSSGFFLTLINLFYPNFMFPWQSRPLAPAHLQGKLYSPIFDNNNEKFNFYLFISESAKLNLKGKEEEKDAKQPNWLIKDIDPLTLSQELSQIDLTIPKSIWKKNKGQLYFHSVLCPNKFSPYKLDKNFNIDLCSTTWGSVIKYEEVLKDNTVNLLDKKQTSNDENQKENENGKKKSKKAKKEPKIAHLKPYIHINLVFDQTKYPLAFVPNDVAQLSKAINNNNQIQYLPWVYHNEIGLRREQLTPIYSNKTLPINLQLDNSALGMVRFYSLMNHRLASLNDQSSLFKLSEKEVDDLRQMFFETSPVLLLTTLIAGLLHSLFEFLAFQSDVQHWKKKKSMEGTSHASLLMSALAALLNTFYLYDQREDTSLLVLLGAIAACLIELWKVFKSYRLKASVEETSDKQKITDEVDNVVFYWTTRLSIPIAVTYSAYTINNYKFSGYYSWALDSCMALVYLLGFMNLVPQVVLNHRLKSVESVPIAAFCFRALNTFVDDLFALVIPMPTLTRLSMLRDDLVFVVFLYQWYKYPKRKEEEEEGEKEGEEEETNEEVSGDSKKDN